MNIKVLRLEDLEHILAFEKRALAAIESDEMQRELKSWHAPWRREALEHYLPGGWCFAVWHGEEGESPLLGYFLAQVLLFYQGMTQTMWLEHLSADSPEVGSALVDVIYRLSREKHMQKLMAPSTEKNLELFSHLKPNLIDTKFFAVKTAKII